MNSVLPPRFAAVACAMALASLATSSQAADIYRWTDAQGKVHLSDKPPPGNPDAAIRTESKQFEPSAADRKAALERAARDKARLAEMEKQRGQAAMKPASGASAAAAAASKPQQVAGGTECERKQREFQKSQECFAPYRLATGGVRQEGLEKCGAALPDPGQCR
jgi:hypothetical protein